MYAGIGNNLSYNYRFWYECCPLAVFIIELICNKIAGTIVCKCTSGKVVNLDSYGLHVRALFPILASIMRKRERLRWSYQRYVILLPAPRPSWNSLTTCRDFRIRLKCFDSILHRLNTLVFYVILVPTPAVIDLNGYGFSFAEGDLAGDPRNILDYDTYNDSK